MGGVTGTGIDHGHVGVAYHVCAGAVERVLRGVVADDSSQKG